MNYVNVSGGLRVYGAGIFVISLVGGFVAEGLDFSDTSHMLRKAAAHTIQKYVPQHPICVRILPSPNHKNPPPLIISIPISYWTVVGLCLKIIMGTKKGPHSNPRD